MRKAKSTCEELPANCNEACLAFNEAKEARRRQRLGLCPKCGAEPVYVALQPTCPRHGPYEFVDRDKLDDPCFDGGDCWEGE